MNWLNNILAEMDAITLGIVASVFSVWFGGNESLLVLVQYLFLLDVSLLCCAGSDIPLRRKMMYAVKKYASLYLGVLLVGVGTRAFDVAIQSTIHFQYSGSFFFDIFIYTLVVFELSCINRHLARMGFVVNIGIEALFRSLLGKIFKRLKIDLSKEDIDKLATNNELYGTDLSEEVPKDKKHKVIKDTEDG